MTSDESAEPCAAAGRQRWRDDLAREVDELVTAASDYATGHSPELAAVDRVHRDDALNLLHYLALRHRDVRDLQRRLTDHGLSSLGRSEAHVLATVLAVAEALGRTIPPPAHVDFAGGRRALDRNTDRLFGQRPVHRVPRIMVTLPTEAAHDPAMVRDFGEKGMDVARINGAHDEPDIWEAMARQVEEASAALGRHIPICFDLQGPKLRTGPVAAGPEVVRLRPIRDARGVAILPARIRLVAAHAAHGADTAHGAVSLPAATAAPTRVEVVDDDWLAGCAPGDRVHLRDTRGSPRTFVVTACRRGAVEAEVWDTTYIETGMRLCNDRRTTTIGRLAPVERHLLLAPGDLLRVTEDMTPTQPWRTGMPGLASIGCSRPEVFAAIRTGQRVMFDDGRFTAVVEEVLHGAFIVRVRSAPTGGRLRADKGINVPDSDLPIPVVGDRDTALLGIAATHGDMLGLSFLRRKEDVDEVIDRLDRLGAGRLGLILKIETIGGFEHLPEILLRAMRRPRVGVMIARGDLAVESSFQRLAEVQEEILWLREAAHLPVVWATEVLDQLARTGRPSRAEITDAAMAQRAECVMLNKGPFVAVAIETLDDILRRMSGHQRKKAALLRPLRSSGGW
jgi:pyruvate kinase